MPKPKVIICTSRHHILSQMELKFSMNHPIFQVNHVYFSICLNYSTFLSILTRKNPLNYNRIILIHGDICGLSVFNGRWGYNFLIDIFVLFMLSIKHSYDSAVFYIRVKFKVTITNLKSNILFYLMFYCFSWSKMFKVLVSHVWQGYGNPQCVT